jgi:asparagine synthase (glutamine-hydrolysing)
MANSVEVRVPYLDHRIMEFAYSLPREYKLGPLGKIKRILVEAFADQLPSYIVRRRKAGFGMPIRSTFQSREKVYELLDLDFLAGVAPFDRAHIRQLIDSHADGREDNSSIIYALISFQEWYRTYFRGQV